MGENEKSAPDVFEDPGLYARLQREIEDLRGHLALAAHALEDAGVRAPTVTMGVRELDRRHREVIDEVQKQKRIVAKERELARRWYRADGSFEVLDSEDAVIEKRKAAAKELAVLRSQLDRWKPVEEWAQNSSLGIAGDFYADVVMRALNEPRSAAEPQEGDDVLRAFLERYEHPANTWRGEVSDVLAELVRRALRPRGLPVEQHVREILGRVDLDNVDRRGANWADYRFTAGDLVVAANYLSDLIAKERPRG